MTFGIFAGLAASFPLMIKNLYMPLDKTINPLDYAFYGPLIGSLIRGVFGKIADKFGGAILTHITGIALIILFSVLIFGGYLTPTSADQFKGFIAIVMLIFFFTGIGNASTFKQFPMIFYKSPRRAAGVIGWTSAMAAFGPFTFSILITLLENYLVIPSHFSYTFCYLVSWLRLLTGIIILEKGCERPS